MPAVVVVVLFVFSWFFEERVAWGTSPLVYVAVDEAVDVVVDVL